MAITWKLGVTGARERVSDGENKEIMVWLCHYRGCRHGGIQCLMNNGCLLKKLISYSFFQGCCTGSCLWSLCQSFNIFIVCFQKYDAVWRHWNNTSKQFHPNTMGLFKRIAYFLWSLQNNYRTTILTHKYFFISWQCEEKNQSHAVILFLQSHSLSWVSF